MASEYDGMSVANIVRAMGNEFAAYRKDGRSWQWIADRFAERFGRRINNLGRIFATETRKPGVLDEKAVQECLLVLREARRKGGSLIFAAAPLQASAPTEPRRLPAAGQEPKQAAEPVRTVQPEAAAPKWVIDDPRFAGNPLINAGPDDMSAAVDGGYAPFDPVPGFDMAEHLTGPYPLLPSARPFAWLVEALRYKREVLNERSRSDVSMRDGRPGCDPIIVALSPLVQKKIMEGKITNWDKVDFA